jgi:hypothetical protein
MKRLGMLIVLVSAVIAAAPGSVLAVVQRWASPSGSGTHCDHGSPCSIVTAINSPSAFNDVEVVLVGNQGTYATQGSPISTELAPKVTNVSIHGARGQPRPVIYSDAGPFGLVVRDGKVHDLAIYDSNGTAAAIGVLGARADHVLAFGNQSVGCGGEGATFTNSLCVGYRGGAGFQDYVPPFTGSGHDTLRNDTLIGVTTGAFTFARNDSVDVSMTNTIVHGDFVDVLAQASGLNQPSVTVSLDHSNYRTTDRTGFAAITPAGSGTNQTAAPRFVGAPAHDYHEAAGSPTIGAGINSPLNGTTDLDGNPRTINGKTDIGAYEYVAPTLGIRAPALLKLKFRPSKFKLGKHHTKPRISYTESEAAAVTFYIYEIRHGRLLPVGTFTRSDHAGRNSFAFSGKVNGKKLKHGRYELVADPVAFGLPGSVVNVKFRVE